MQVTTRRNTHNRQHGDCINWNAPHSSLHIIHIKMKTQLTREVAIGKSRVLPVANLNKYLSKLHTKSGK